MRKNWKKILCGALISTMVASSVCSSNPKAFANTVEYVSEVTQNNAEATLTIHAKGDGLKIYVWKGETPLNGKWPGNAMSADSTMGSGWCMFETSEAIDGLIICDSNGNKLTDDVKDKTSGEYWYADGKWSDKNPNGDVTPTKAPENTKAPTESDTPTPTSTPATSKTGDIKINSVTPEDKAEITAGEKVTIKVDATSDINDGKIYYKYEVKCNGEFVGDHYYMVDANTYTFTPASGMTYDITVYAQAHDEDNTTVTKKLTYKSSGKAGEVTQAPTVTDEPKTTATATPKPTGTTGTKSDMVVNLDVKKTTSIGKKLTLKAEVYGGSAPYLYRFVAKKGSDEKVICDYDEADTCTWTPSAKGTYSVTVDVIDANNNEVSSDVVKVTVKPLAVKITSPSKKTAKLKSKVKVVAKTSYAYGTVKYKYVVKLNGKVVAKTKNYGTSKTFTWKPTKKGTYTIIVYAKDKKSKATAKISKFTVK